MLTALLAWLSIWWQPLIGFSIISGLIWYVISQGRKIDAWENTPEQIAIRQKQAYDDAHAYLKGKCCCGRIKD